MNRENKFLLINALILLLLGSLVLFVYSSVVLTSKVDKMFNAKVNLVAVEDKDIPTEIKEANEVYKGKKKIGMLFDTYKENDFGTISLLVAIDQDNKIIGIEQNIDQNYPLPEHSEQVFNYVKKYIGSKVNDIKVDGVTKPTTSFTIGAVDDIFEAISNFVFGEVVVEPEAPELGVNFVAFKKDGQTLTGATYQVTTDSINIDGSTSVARLSFKITIGLEGEITGYEEVWYKHTGGNFKTQALEFFNSLIGKKLDEVNISLLDGVTGATNSKKAIIGLIDELEAYLEEHPFTLATRVKDLGNRKYNITKLSYYFNNFNELSFDVTLDENNKLVSYEVITYRHTEGTFKQDALDFFDTLIGKDINTVLAENSDIDGKVGATNSGKAILNMLNDLSLYIKGENIPDPEQPEEPVAPEVGVKFLSYVLDGQNLTGAVYQVTADSINVRQNINRLSFKITIGLDNKIKGYEEVWYKHTGGDYKAQTLAFFDSLIGKTLDEVTLSLLDGTSGATNSRTAIIGLIDDLKSYLTTNPFTVKTQIKDLGNNKYNLTKLSYYHNNFGLLSFDVELDEHGKLVRYTEVIYNHSGRTHKTTTTNFFDGLIGKTLDEITMNLLDGSSGATYSKRAVLEMLTGLKAHIQEGN